MSNFKPVDLPQGAGNGVIQVLRSGKLITITNGAKDEQPLAKGTVVTGIFNGTTPNKYNPERVDYNLRGDDGTLIILAETASLKKQFDKVQENDLLQVTYNGMRQITRKNGSVTDMHDFMVARASAE